MYFLSLCLFTACGFILFNEFRSAAYFDCILVMALVVVYLWADLKIILTKKSKRNNGL